jgi:hypothetical protein
MTTKKNEETEPEVFTRENRDNTQVEDAGVPGQIEYPDASVDAERAAAFAAGKVDTLYEDDEDKSDREKIQDDIDNYDRDEDSDKDSDKSRAKKDSKNG